MSDTKADDPTKEPEFQRVLKNMLSTPPKPRAEIKGKTKKRPKPHD